MKSENASGRTEGSSAALAPVSEAERLFELLAADLEEGRGDPEALIAAHPELAEELRALYRGWREADALFRSVAEHESLVRAVRAEFSLAGGDERATAALARLACNAFEERYEVRELIGQGGMGVVRLVTDRVLGRDLAMKTIRPVEPARRARLLRRFLDEADVIGRLEHPGIVPIHELGLDAEGQVYFTMPLVRGATLQEILPLANAGREGWTMARLLEVLLKACDALTYAHSRGVLHRDLKPANVMVGHFGEVYVMDWGLARSLKGIEQERASGEPMLDEGLTLEGEVLGTPAYMAPEQARGPREMLDERCDVYSVGAILYEMLAGERPYGRCSSAEILEQLGEGPPPAIDALAPDANGELRAIVRRAMAWKREERYRDVAQLASDLRAFLAGRVVRAHRTGTWVEASKWVRRNRMLTTALVLAFTSLTLGLATSLVLFGRAQRERTNVFRLAQARTLATLIEEAETLAPPHPSRIPELRRWVERAHTLERALEPDPASDDPGLRAQREMLERRRADWSEEERWWHGELSALIAGTEALRRPADGLLMDGVSAQGRGMAWRIAQAERLERSQASVDVQSRWSEARAAIAAHPAYAGLELEQQEGLVPLGPDPRSGLWEFAHELSGEVPARGLNGELALGDESALVLVLLPGGEFLMGSQVDDAAKPNYTTVLVWDESPAHARRIAPLLLAKTEMTQGQWLRTAGSNPSYHTGDPRSASFPVESISWLVARRELARAGLRLPSEAEWEYACRAGTTTTYFWGEDLGAVTRYGNVKDLDALAPPDLGGVTYSRNAPPLPEGAVMNVESQAYTPVRDGFVEMAPVRSFLPNSWGLHDMIGNVWEWCEDRYDLYPGSRGSATEARIPRSELKVMRGGASHRPATPSSYRGREAWDFAYQGVGVRPARSLDP